MLSGVKGHITQAHSADIAPTARVPDTSSSAKPIVIGFGLVALAIFAAALLLYNRLAPESSLVPGIAEVERSPVADIATQPVTTQPSIAVLPFDNLSPLAENAYFAAGIHEDVLSALSKVQALKVISRTSVMRFADTNKSLPDIARELGAAHILEGSVRRSGNQVRITVQLIDASTDEHLWAETYDRQLEDIFAIQSEVATKITEALKVALDVGTIVELERMPTDNFEAYDLYMKGRALLNTRSSGGIQDALRMFEEAIVREPEFALAHAGKADALVSVAYSSGDWPSVRESGLTAAETAIQFDPDSAYTNITMARVYQMDSNLAETTAYVDKVLELHPNYAMAFRMKGDLEYFLGHNEAAYNNWKKFVEMDPLNPRNNRAMALVLAGMERFTESDSYVARLLELEPTANNYMRAGGFYFISTKPDRFNSLKHLREGHRLDPGSIGSMVGIVTVLQLLGDHAAAMQWLTLAQQIAPHNETLYARRLDSLAYARKQDQFDQLLSDWYSYDPNSILYHRYASSALSRKAFDLSAQERFDDAIAVWQEAISHDQIFAKASTVDGEIRVTVVNV